MSAVADVTIVDSSGGANLASVRFAFLRLGASVQVTGEPREIAHARRVVLPGVGCAADAMQRLREASLVPVLRGLKQPVLGICLGMQLLFEQCEEGGTQALGLLPGVVSRLQAEEGVSVPHMGWNRLLDLRSDPLLAGLEHGAYVYFLHSYAAGVSNVTLATTEHGRRFAAVCRQDNFCGMQFHPERAGSAGSRLLDNFLRLACC